MILEGIGYPHVVRIEPIITDYDCLGRVHLHKVHHILHNQLLHLFRSCLGNAVTLSRVILDRALAVTVLQTVLNFFQPSEDFSLNALDAEEHL